jgi:hypothetical protein
LRFSIRSLFVAVTMIAIVIQILAVSTRDYRKRLRISADLRSMGATHIGFDENGNPDWVSFVSSVNSPEISKYKKIRHVDLSEACVTDATIRNVSGLDEIEVLHLTQCDVTDDQLELLAHIGSLKILRLNNTGITDKAIPAIASINGLMSVDLSGTLVSNSGVEELESRRPGIVVRHATTSWPTNKMLDRSGGDGPQKWSR